MASKADFDNFDGEFDLGAFRDWEKNPYTQFVLKEVQRMANLRLQGIRNNLHLNNSSGAIELNGELNAFEEVLQIADLIVDDWKTILGETKQSEQSK